MLGLFKSKEKKRPEIDTDRIAAELFAQISAARDAAKDGGIVNEQVFNDRLNNMFAAGYLIGYVDEHLSLVTDDEIVKRDSATEVFETMFPGSGIDFVRGRLAARRKAATSNADEPAFREAALQCRAFDKGMADAREEVASQQRDETTQPKRLKEFLLLGEV